MTAHDNQGREGKENPDEQSVNGMIAGLAIGISVIVIISGVAFTVWFTRKRKISHTDDKKSESITVDGQTSKDRRISSSNKQRPAVQKVSTDEILTKSDLPSKLKIATPKMRIDRNIRIQNQPKVIDEEYVIHHDYINDKDDSLDYVYDEYIIPHE